MLEIRESQIEDILAANMDDVKNILGVGEDLSLVSRQKKLPSGGKLDLLFLSAKSLLLIELKVVKCEDDFCEQIVNYRNDIIKLQRNDKMPSLPIKSFLVCPEFSDHHLDLCRELDVSPIVYSPFELLKNYYFRVKAITRLINLKPSNHGLWNLRLLNCILYAIKDKTTKEQIVSVTGLSKSTIGSYLRLSSELGLTRRKGFVILTDLGEEYIKLKDKDSHIDFISDEQSEVIRDFITNNPFFSKAVYGIYTAVETIFVLSKNCYPVNLEDAVLHFKYLSGKSSEWGKKASHDAFTMYSNYCIELGLLAKVDRNYYITPAGLKFILLLELNKSILIVNSI